MDDEIAAAAGGSTGAGRGRRLRWRRYLRFNTRLLFLLFVVIGGMSAIYRHRELQRRELVRTIVDSGGRVETSESMVPFLNGWVRKVVLPGTALEQIPVQDLKKFTFLKIVSVEDYVYSGVSVRDPKAVTGSFELEGGLPGSWVDAHQMMRQLMPKQGGANRGTSAESISEATSSQQK